MVFTIEVLYRSESRSNLGLDPVVYIALTSLKPMGLSVA